MQIADGEQSGGDATPLKAVTGQRQPFRTMIPNGCRGVPQTRAGLRRPRVTSGVREPRRIGKDECQSADMPTGHSVGMAGRPAVSGMKGNRVSPLSPTALISNTTPIPASLQTACGKNPGVACRLAWNISHDVNAARLVASYVANPLNVALRIGFVILLAIVANWLAHRFIARLTGGAQKSLVPKRLRAKAAAVLEASPVVFSERRHQRAQALGSIMCSIASALIFGIAALTILGDLGINLAPLLASAGVAGVAIGFGAQNVVKDFLSGIFMLLEDQYGVGDVIDADVATGTVEAVGLRVTRVRDINGVVWHIRNGTIDRVGNKSQGWSRAVVDLPLGYDQDVRRARETMKQAAVAMWRDSRWRDLILEEPDVWGVQELLSNAVVLRVVAKTVPLKQWEVARELRERLMAALDEQGVRVGVPSTDASSQIQSA